MPRLTVTEHAARGLEHCRQFLKQENQIAANRAGQQIGKYFSLLMTEPTMGKPYSNLPELREFLIPFGDSGYVALYGFNESTDEVVLLAFRNQKEAGY